MNVLILDHNYEPGVERPAMSYIGIWTNYFTRKGHSVVTVRHLDDLSEEGKTLDDFACAVVHPDATDAGALYSLLQDRPDFRMIIHSSGRDGILGRMKESDNAIYLRLVTNDDLDELLGE